MARTATRSTQFLAGLSTLLLVVTAGFSLFILVGAVAGFGPNGHEVAVHSRVDAEEVAGLPEGTVLPDSLRVTVRVRNATRQQLRWAAGRDLVPGLVIIAGTFLLRGLLLSLRDGDPFTQANVQRLRALAVLVLVGIPAAALLGAVFATALASSAGLDGGGTQLALPGNALIGALAAFVLAEVFPAGVRLREGLEGTV
jgi:hypothetical protein